MTYFTIWWIVSSVLYLFQSCVLLLPLATLNNPHRILPRCKCDIRSNIINIYMNLYTTFLTQGHSKDNKSISQISKSSSELTRTFIWRDTHSVDFIQSVWDLFSARFPADSDNLFWKDCEKEMRSEDLTGIMSDVVIRLCILLRYKDKVHLHEERLYLCLMLIRIYLLLDQFKMLKVLCIMFSCTERDAISWLWHLYWCWLRMTLTNYFILFFKNILEYLEYIEYFCKWISCMMLNNRTSYQSDDIKKDSQNEPISW